nr:AUGMIN subunit 4 [Ipomoea batatas]
MKPKDLMRAGSVKRLGSGILAGVNATEAREEMRKERPHYLEAWVYEVLELWLVAAEAAQRLRLPLISRDDEIEEWSVLSRSSLDSTSSSVTMSST